MRPLAAHILDCRFFSSRVVYYLETKMVLEDGSTSLAVSERSFFCLCTESYSLTILLANHQLKEIHVCYEHGKLRSFFCLDLDIVESNK
jgi:hypothetical protein